MKNFKWCNLFKKNKTENMDNHKLTDNEIYQKIQTGELRTNVEYKGKQLTYEDVSSQIRNISIVSNGGGLNIGEYALGHSNFEEEYQGNGICEIYRLVVDEKFQKQGYGKCLMYMFLTYAQIKGYTEIHVSNNCKNVPDFYSRFRWNGKTIIEYK